tara:strand:+ start:291 stop:452 length:162 start_codon:yes stop_codon:yes gene_type:complete
MREQDPNIKVKKEVKEKLENLDFVKKHTNSEIIGMLIKFYESHKNIFKKWKKK